MTNMIFRGLAAAAVSVSLASGADAEPVKFARYPHISNYGQIAFSYHGDIWVADSNGDNPRRLTAHIARDIFPRFSPDGRSIAFTSNRMGNDDVWVVSTEGGEPRQLTHHSTGDTVLNWTPCGEGVLISTSRGASPWGSPLYIVPLDGSRPEPLPMDRGAAGMISQDGMKVAFNRSGFRYWRKHYRGNANTDIWVQDLASEEIRQLTDLDMKEYRNHTQDAHPMWGADGMIYFMSERNDVFNIWKIDPNGGDPVQVTFHESDGVQYPSISPDGRIIVYENEFELWKLDINHGGPVRIQLDMAFDPKENLIEYRASEGHAEGFSPSPDGEVVAVDYHGEIFMIPTDPETAEKKQVTASAWRDRYEQYSPDGKHIAYISDESGDEEIWLYTIEDGSRSKLTAHESVKRDMLWSPDSTKIVFTADLRLFQVTIESGEMEELAYNEEGGFYVTSFSDDGNWLIYGRTDADLDREVYLFNLQERTEYNLTDHPAADLPGYLTPDGSKLVFRSDRDGGVYHLYAVSLTRVTEDPDDPLVKAAKDDKHPRRDEKKKEDEATPDDKSPTTPESPSDEDDVKDDADGKDEPAQPAAPDGEGEAEEKKAEDEGPTLEMDLEGIDRRPRRLTDGNASVGSFFLDKEGKKVYFTRSGALYSVSIDGGEAQKIASGSFRYLSPTYDRKTVFYSDRGNVYKMSLSRKKAEQVKFDFQVKIDTRAEWEQVFEESWRVMKYRFYDEDMHGFDWDAIKARYKPLLRYVGENQDLYDLCNEMIGELNASHTGVGGPPTRSMDRLYTTRELGFEMETDGSHYAVGHIYRDGPADKEWLDLSVGDRILAIEGREIGAGDNYYPVLNHPLNDYVNVVVASPVESEGESAMGEPRTIRIRPVTSLRNIKYEEWVNKNREFVDAESDGKVAYVHIRSMGRSSLRRFEIEINRYWNKNGMIIDIRYNGGGNIDQELIDILERKPYEYWNYRMGGRAWGRRPHQAIAGPQVMLINWRSASDSEVTPQAFRDLGLGRIVGNPTYGAVIATGGYRLLNGAYIRTPGSLVTTYDPSQPYNYGVNLENFGVAPDVWVENTPADELAGYDRELKAAVDEALRMLEEGTWQYGEDD